MSRYTTEVKHRLIASRLAGESIDALSRRLGVSKTSLYKWISERTKSPSELNFKPMVVENTTNFGYTLTIRSGVSHVELTGEISPEYIRTLLRW
jgi:transposase-like protein